MEFKIAKRAGFCFGVKKAVETVENSMGKFPKLYTLGEIIHNPQVVKKFKDNGVYPVTGAQDVEDGAVIIRSHGAPKKEIQSFVDKNIQVVDATCPFVSRIQKIVEKAFQENKFIIIIGEKEHPEVIGINGYADNTGFVVNSIQEASTLPETEKAICVVAQTTTRHDLYQSIIEVIKQKYVSNKIDVYSTICDATSQRQSEAMEIANLTLVIMYFTDSIAHFLFEHVSDVTLRARKSIMFSLYCFSQASNACVIASDIFLISKSTILLSRFKTLNISFTSYLLHEAQLQEYIFLFRLKIQAFRLY